MRKEKSIWQKDVFEYAPIRWLAIFVGLIFLLIGVPSLYEKILKSATFDHNFKFAIAATAWGVILLFVAIQKEIRNKTKKN